MRQTKVFILLMTALLCLNNVLTVSAAGQESIEEYVEDFRSETKCDSVSVVVVNGEETEFYGDEKGLYQIGSMTKAFTGLAVQKLIKEEVIKEDDCLSELLQGFTAYYESRPVVGLKEILFTWAPYSFAGGLLILAVNVLAAILTMRRIKNNHGSTE